MNLVLFNPDQQKSEVATFIFIYIPITFNNYHLLPDILIKELFKNNQNIVGCSYKQLSMMKNWIHSYLERFVSFPEMVSGFVLIFMLPI